MPRMQNQIHPTSQGRPAFSSPQTLHRQMNGHQGGRASRIHGQAGALEIAKIGKAIGDRGRGSTGQHKIALQRSLGGQELIFAIHHPRKHPNGSLGGRIGRSHQGTGG